MKYIILVGLPASGKSTWASKYVNKDYRSRKEIRLISCDNYLETKHPSYNSLEEYIKAKLNDMSRSIYIHKEIVLDGLFTTNDSVIKVIDVLKPHPDDFIEIRQWKEDREQCIANDAGRRKVSSKIDILNLPYEDIDIEDIKEKANHRFVGKILMDVHAKDREVIFAESNGIDIDLDGKFYSSKWVVGGQWGNCWGDSGSVSVEEPCEFDEFDKLLEKICPNITFLQYKKIKAECVSVEYSEEYGHYRSCTKYNYYACNIYKLYDYLKAFGLIE